MTKPGNIEERDVKGAARPCPICGKPAGERYRPFCSARCQTIDLARWIGGNYRIPSMEDDDPPDPEDAPG
ncbi:MAG: DNA gyrase inhibitor YacG [Stellaceae bacterium]